MQHCLLLIGLLFALFTRQNPTPTIFHPADYSAIPRIAPKVVLVRPRLVALSSEYPPELAKIPASLKSAVFGTLSIGPAEKPSRVVIAVEERAGQPPLMLADANNNGDLTDDPPLTPIASRFVRKDGVTTTEYVITPSFEIRYGANTSKISVNLRWLDPQDARRANNATPVLYYANYFTTGELVLGEKTYRGTLVDIFGKGDFRGAIKSPVSGILLLIDVNGNGVYDGRGEAFDVQQPFTIGGVTYELTQIAANGEAFTVARSSKKVPEVLPPPDLRPGRPATPFQAKTLSGKAVRFPETYQGKLVLLYFWGSWCGDCKAEVPYIAKAWERFHKQDFDVLGVSVDYPNQASELAKYVQENRLPPDHIYDGKQWNADIVQLYGVTSIPTPYLVDGSTGKVAAWGEDLLGERLLPTLERALAERKNAKRISRGKP